MTNVCLVLSIIVVLLSACQSTQVSSAPAVELTAQGVPGDVTAIAAPVGLNLTAAVGYEADAETLAKIRDSIDAFSVLLWEKTCGNMYVKSVQLKNNSQDGYMHFEKLEKLGGHAQFGGPFTVNTNLLDLDVKSGKPGVGVRVLAAGIMHEFGHSMLRLQDEYGTTRECIMHPQSRTKDFCQACKEELLNRFKLWRFPAEPEKADWLKTHPCPKAVIS